MWAEPEATTAATAEAIGATREAPLVEAVKVTLPDGGFAAARAANPVCRTRGPETAGICYGRIAALFRRLLPEIGPTIGFNRAV